MKRSWILYLFLLPALALFATGCDDDDDNGTNPIDMSDTFELTIANVSAAGDYLASGVFNTPDGADEPGPLTPGNTYTINFSANPGQELHVATMMVQTNDIVIATPGGVSPYNGNGDPLTGDITGRFTAYDAGTEVNEEPGTSDNQPPRQSSANMGETQDGSITRVDDSFLYEYPDVSEVIMATLTHNGGHSFTLTIENVSEPGTIHTSEGEDLPVPISPGVWAVADDGMTLFTEGTPAPEGLEELAEDGNPAVFAEQLAMATGLATPLSPGVWAIHDDGFPIFENGTAASPALEDLAEDGMPDGIMSNLDGLAFVEEHGVFSESGLLTPGNQVTITFEAAPGDKLSLLTMFVQSNDLFYALDGGDGYELFDDLGQAREGDLTGDMALWDAGTELNQFPGAGADQAPRQSGPDTGAADSNSDVRPVDDGYMYPAPGEVLQVTLTVVD